MYPVILLSSFVLLANGQSVPCDHPLAIAEGKTCRAVQILTPLPETPSCKNPYSYAIGELGNDCSNVTAPPYQSVGVPDWTIGNSYSPAYPGALFTVTNISYSIKRPGIMIITGEWNTPGTMPLSFYVDQAPGPFFASR
jgi:hypothetical protein